MERIAILCNSDLRSDVDKAIIAKQNIDSKYKRQEGLREILRLGVAEFKKKKIKKEGK